MKKFVAILALGCALACGIGAQKQDAPPSWAYPVAASDYKQEVDEGGVRHVPNSTAGWTLTQLRDLFFAPDWHPNDHPVMPEVVARGRKPDVYACGFCHRADGPGGPENSGLAGLPQGYIVEQLADFKSGARKSALPQRLPVVLMASIAKAATDTEVAEAAAYFSKLIPRKIITVTETKSVPKTYVAGWLFAPINEKDTEPIGQRIIEVPKDLEQFESRDTHSEFIAYVPVGSVAKGKALATTGGKGKTVACETCHGKGLRGQGLVPGIAGRSPSYLVRQLYDFQLGARKGAASGQMEPVVVKLTAEDKLELAAYAASLNP